MRHHSLPITLTTEALAQWIDTNRVEDPFDHVEKLELSPEEISSHEHNIANASRAILTLDELKKEFSELIKNGTPVEDDGDGNPTPQPYDITIPPTKGLKKLTANVEFHSQILSRGYNEVTTKIYRVPWPEAKTIIAIDIEGNEWAQYSKPMTREQMNLYVSLFENAPETDNVLEEKGEDNPILDL